MNHVNSYSPNLNKVRRVLFNNSNQEYVENNLFHDELTEENNMIEENNIINENINNNFGKKIPNLSEPIQKTVTLIENEGDLKMNKETNFDKKKNLQNYTFSPTISRKNNKLNKEENNEVLINQNNNLKKIQTEHENKLLIVKNQCNNELKIFLESLENQWIKLKENKIFLENNQNFEICNMILTQMNFLSNSIIHLSLEDIKKGECQQIVDKIVQLQQECFKNKWPWRDNVTKLLLIISRLSRFTQLIQIQLNIEKNNYQVKINMNYLE